VTAERRKEAREIGPERAGLGGRAALGPAPGGVERLQDAQVLVAELLVSACASGRISTTAREPLVVLGPEVS
jgi:hypothetical protein